MKIMDTTWIRFCVLAMMTSLTYSTKHRTADNRQQLLSKLSSQNESATRYIDLSVSLLGQNFSQHMQVIIDAISNVDQVFQIQLNTSVILSNLRIIPMTSSLESRSDVDTLRSFELFKKNSTSDSTFLVRFSSTSAIESTFDTMCSSSFTGGVINVVAMDGIGALARQLMYGLGRNLGLVDHRNLSDSCKCETQGVCMMDKIFISTSSSENPLSVSNCNIQTFTERQSSCLGDKPSQLPDSVTCRNGLESSKQCDCRQDDSECKECIDNSACVVCSNGRCCPDCQFIRGCNSRDCVCRDVIGKGAVAASSECLDQLQYGAFCGTSRNCSILNTECDIVICRAEDASFQVPDTVKVTDVSIIGSQLCSNLYAVKSFETEASLTDGIVCKDNDVCIHGKCEENSCYDSKGGICSNNGECDENKCLCNCEWSGRSCNIRDHKKKCRTTGSPDKPTYNPTGLQTTHIIAGFIGIFFAAAVISGATSLGYKRLQKRNRLQTKHERNMLSLFEPTRRQKQRLARQYNKRSDQDFHYNERYRIPTDINSEQRLMDEGMPPPILCTAVKHSSRDVSVI